MIEYEFGKNGKHLLVINSYKHEMQYLHQLKKTLGDDFEFLMNCNEKDADDWEADIEDLSEGLMADGLKRAMDSWQKMMEESKRHPVEIYSYDYPEYPKLLNVKNQFIADKFLSKTTVLNCTNR